MRLLRHTGIYVSDIELMRNFYCDTFNLSVEVHAIEEGEYIETVLGKKGIKIEVYKLSTQDNCLVELIKTMSPVEDSNISKMIYSKGTYHLAFTVNNIDELYQRLRAKGITFLSEPKVSYDGKAVVCFCQDPENNYIELVEEL